MATLATRPAVSVLPGPVPDGGAGLVAGSGCEGSGCLHSSIATGLAGLLSHTRPSECTCQAEDPLIHLVSLRFPGMGLGGWPGWSAVRRSERNIGIHGHFYSSKININFLTKAIYVLFLKPSKPIYVIKYYWLCGLPLEHGQIAMGFTPREN